MKPSRVFAFLKMYPVSQVSMMGVPLNGYLRRLPRWGWMRNGDIFEHQILERPTSANGGGSWPTPRRGDRESFDAGMRRDSPSLSTLAKMWGTPTANAYKGSGQHGSASWGHDLERGYLRAQVIQDNVKAQLNPDWVELLLGLPQGWTDLTEGED